MLAALLRTFGGAQVSIASGGCASDPFDLRKCSMGVLHMPAAWTAASIGFQVATTQSGTFAPLYDMNGSLVQISGPSADQSCALPAALAGCHWVKLWSQDGAGADVNQAAARAITLDLKS